MSQQEQFNNYSFNYYNYANNGNVNTYDYSSYHQTSPSNQSYSWSNYQYGYPNYIDYNSYQSVYYNQLKSAPTSSTSSSTNHSFTSSNSDFNSNQNSPIQPLNLSTNQTDYNVLDSRVSNPSPVTDYIKPPTRKQFESTPKTRSIKSASRHYQLPDRAVEIMNDWFLEHLNNPYPQQSEKEHLAKLGGISVKQVTAWFSNRRNRSQNTKPKRMKRVLEQEINNIFSEFVTDQVSKDVIIEKLRSTLVDHEINSNQS